MSKMFFEVKKYIPEKHMFDIMEYLKEKKVSFNFNTFKSTKTLKLKIYTQEIKLSLISGAHQKNENIFLGCNENLYGGKNESKNIKISLRNDKYQAKIYEYDDGYSKSISFVKINSIFNDNNDDFNEDDICGVILIDKDNNADINSIVNYKDCIKCFDNKTFKIGEVLIQIMIGVCVYKNVNKIELKDNSYLECGNEKIPLIYLRTITHGKPYYTKFNFLPVNHNEKNEDEYYNNEIKIYNDNIEIFKTNPKINKKKLIKILNYKKFDDVKDKNIIDYINNEIIPNLKDENISIRNFVNNLIKNKKKISCYLLKNILMNLYYKGGYNEYKYKKFVFILDKKYKDIIKTHIQIKNL